jgi:biopolymer transport protein ExbD
MARTNSVLESEDKFDMTSMIDVVFLLLIYFMYLPIQQEADLLFSLPANAAPSANATLPNELSIDIAPDGSIFLNGAPIDRPGDLQFKDLTSTMTRLRQSADRSGIATVVTIFPDADSPHQASISVLDACAAAGIKQVSFAEAD